MIELYIFTLVYAPYYINILASNNKAMHKLWLCTRYYAINQVLWKTNRSSNKQKIGQWKASCGFLLVNNPKVVDFIVNKHATGLSQGVIQSNSLGL